jgi:hypothetical protein
MRARSHSADRLSSLALLIGVGAGGVVVISVALPLAFSSPFPTLRDGGDWVVDTSPFTARLVMTSPVEPPPETDGRFVVASLGDAASDQPMTFAERWNLRVPQAAIPALAAVEPDEEPAHGPARTLAEPHAAEGHDAAPRKPAAPGARTAAVMATVPKLALPPEDPVQDYLWEVYQRKPVKSDSSGDFTWKDQAAAKRLGISLRSYAIGGMDPDFREQLYHAGHAMDAAGLHWSMLSAFRDDYRQGLASGFKAHGGNSLHGGSRATGGYGHGRAIDITGAEGDSDAVWHWVDAHGSKYGLARPMTRIDPAHIQARGSYHDLAHTLREARHKLEAKINGPAAAAPSKTKVASQADK